MSISAFNPAANAPAMNAPAMNTAAPAANAPTFNTSDSFSSSVSPVGATPFQNAAPAANNAAPAVMPPSYNQMPAANAPAQAPAPVQAKSGGGGLFGTIAAAAAGGFAALKYVVPKFLPSLLKNPSTLKTFGIFGAGAAAAMLAFGFIKGKLFGGAAAAQQFPPEAIAQLQQLLAAGVPPQAILQQGVPVEALRQAGAQI